MTIDQAPNYFNLIALKIHDAQLRAAFRASVTGMALMKKRVVSQGELGSGQKMKSYSTNQMSLDKLKSRTGSDSIKKQLIKKGKFTASYTEWRQLNNLQVDHRDLKFTGRMMANIKPVLVASGRGLIKIDINATDASELKKVKDNINRTGNFLTPSKSELAVIKQTYNTELAREMINILK